MDQIYRGLLLQYKYSHYSYFKIEEIDKNKLNREARLYYMRFYLKILSNFFS